MDLAKFISLISKKSLYFTNPKRFNDPYEFYLPKSEMNIIQNIVNQNNKVLNDYLLNNVLLTHEQKSYFNEKINKLQNSLRTIEEQVKEKFGVNCWHINNYENEALWKIYTNNGHGISIETTIDKLKESLTFHREIMYDEVRYQDFNDEIIAKGHKYYGGFIKRKAFEYEKEFRAMVLLDEQDFGKGCFVNVDLDILVEKIHISPSMPKYFLDSIKYLCQGELSFLEDRIFQSTLYEKVENNSMIDNNILTHFP